MQTRPLPFTFTFTFSPLLSRHKNVGNEVKTQEYKQFSPLITFFISHVSVSLCQGISINSHPVF